MPEQPLDNTNELPEEPADEQVGDPRNDQTPAEQEHGGTPAEPEQGGERADSAPVDATADAHAAPDEDVDAEALANAALEAAGSDAEDPTPEDVTPAEPEPTASTDDAEGELVISEDELAAVLAAANGDANEKPDSSADPDAPSAADTAADLDETERAMQEMLNAAADEGDSATDATAAAMEQMLADAHGLAADATESPAEAAAPPPAEPPPGSAPLELPSFEAGLSEADLASLDLLNDVDLDVKIELGRTDMYIEDVLGLGVGSVVELDKLAGDPVDIYVNEKLVARGEVLVLNDNFCVRINDIVSPIPELD